MKRICRALVKRGFAVRLPVNDCGHSVIVCINSTATTAGDSANLSRACDHTFRFLPALFLLPPPAASRHVFAPHPDDLMAPPSAFACRTTPSLT